MSQFKWPKLATNITCDTIVNAVRDDICGVISDHLRKMCEILMDKSADQDAKAYGG